MGNVFSPIGTQLCLILRPMPHAASPTSECPRPPTLRLHAQHRPPSLRDTAGSCRACICICLSMCVSERYFIFQVLWLISVTKISFMTIPICWASKVIEFHCKGLLRGPKLPAQSWVGWEWAWTASPKEWSLLEPSLCSGHKLLWGCVKIPHVGPPGSPGHSKELGDALSYSQQSTGPASFPPSFPDSYRLATRCLIKDKGCPGTLFRLSPVHSLAFTSLTQGVEINTACAAREKAQPWWSYKARRIRTCRPASMAYPRTFVPLRSVHWPGFKTILFYYFILWKHLVWPFFSFQM